MCKLLLQTQRVTWPGPAAQLLQATGCGTGFRSGLNTSKLKPQIANTENQPINWQRVRWKHEHQFHDVLRHTNMLPSKKTVQRWTFLPRWDIFRRCVMIAIPGCHIQVLHVLRAICMLMYQQIYGCTSTNSRAQFAFAAVLLIWKCYDLLRLKQLAFSVLTRAFERV